VLAPVANERREAETSITPLKASVEETPTVNWSTTVATATAAEVSKVNAVVVLIPAKAKVTLPVEVNDLFRILMDGIMQDIPAVDAVGVAAV
jgi:activator of HSP90 ATPase